MPVAGKSRRRIDAEGRECTRCEQYKPWDEYGDGGGPHSKEYRCKDCQVARNAAYLATHPEAMARHIARTVAYQKTDVGKEVNWRAKIKYKYGITAEQYLQLNEQQGGLCYICGLAETITHHSTGEVMRLGVDHDHSCTEGHDPKKGCAKCVRGLACYNCNIYMARVERSELLRPRFLDLLGQRPLLSAA